MNNRFKARGRFQLKVVDAYTREVVQEVDEENLVVTSGMVLLSQLLGGSASGSQVTTISVGTNATAPQATDTAITGAFSKAIDSATYADTGSVTFNFTLDVGDANGMTIAECGLFSASGALFARKTPNPITKTDAVKLIGTWTIQFV